MNTFKLPTFILSLLFWGIISIPLRTNTGHCVGLHHAVVLPSLRYLTCKNKTIDTTGVSSKFVMCFPDVQQYTTMGRYAANVHATCFQVAIVR